MAKTPINAALVELHGKLDAFVYRKLEGETIVARMPHKTDRVPNANQLAVREVFLRGAKYARSVFADPVRKQQYQELAVRAGTPASRLFGFILADYAEPPKIKEINLTRYNRRVGDEIRVFADDNGEVVGVTMALKRANGTVLESGPAVLRDDSWRYVATTVVPPEQPVTVVAVATDRPENMTEQSVVHRGTAPVIEAIDGTGYQGRVGDPIVIRASDDVGVTNVFVMLRSAADTEIESGDALLVNGQWRYLGRTATALPVVVGVSVTDAEGNTAEQRTQLG